MSGAESHSEPEPAPEVTVRSRSGTPVDQGRVPEAVAVAVRRSPRKPQADQGSPSRPSKGATPKNSPDKPAGRQRTASPGKASRDRKGSSESESRPPKASESAPPKGKSSQSGATPKSSKPAARVAHQDKSKEKREKENREKGTEKSTTTSTSQSVPRAERASTSRGGDKESEARPQADRKRPRSPKREPASGKTERRSRSKERRSPEPRKKAKPAPSSVSPTQVPRHTPSPARFERPTVPALGASAGRRTDRSSSGEYPSPASVSRGRRILDEQAHQDPVHVRPAETMTRPPGQRSRTSSLEERFLPPGRSQSALPAFPLGMRPDNLSSFLPNRALNVNLGAGNITAIVPIVEDPQPERVAVRYGPSLFDPATVADSGVYVTTQQVHDTAFGQVSTSYVHRVTGMDVSHPALRLGFWVPAQWALGFESVEEQSQATMRSLTLPPPTPPPRGTPSPAGPSSTSQRRT